MTGAGRRPHAGDRSAAPRDERVSAIYVIEERGADSLRNTNPAASNTNAVPPRTARSIPVNGNEPTVAPLPVPGPPVLFPATGPDPVVSVPCTWDCGSYWAADGLERASWPSAVAGGIRNAAQTPAASRTRKYERLRLCIPSPRFYRSDFPLAAVHSSGYTRKLRRAHPVAEGDGVGERESER
jgi:hypothetical protein